MTSLDLLGKERQPKNTQQKYNQEKLNRGQRKIKKGENIKT
jgi:hypothetical protein